MTGTTTIGTGPTAQIFGTAKNAPAAIEPMDSDTLEKTKQALADLRDKLAQLNAAKAGGTEVEKAQLVIAQQKALGMHDEVAQAQLLLDAHKKDAATAQGGTPGKARGADAGVAEAQAALSEKQAEVVKANLDKQIAETETGSQAWLKASLAKYEFEEARARGNAAEIARLETQKLEAAKTANKQAAADASATETATYQNKKRSLDDQLAAMRANQAEGSLSGMQVLQQTKAIQDQETALDRAHFEDQKRIWQGIPAEYRKAVEQLAQLDAKRISESLKADEQFQEGVVGSYRQAMESIGSTIASSLEGMLERTQRFEDLLRSVARNITSQFLNAGLKMASDWAVTQTKNLAITVATQAQNTAAVVTGQATQTGAVAAGTSAQTGLIGTASITQAAAAAAGAIKSIVAYAAEAAAGATAFASSLLGPAAIGVGAGVEAAVMSLASFDKGAWSLPSDQLAMVHSGEMIVPAFQADTFRNAVSTLASGGGGSGATVNGGINVHVHPQPHHSSRDIADMVVREARRIGRGLATKPK